MDNTKIRFVIPPSEHYRARVASLSSMDVVQQIKQKLTPQQLDLFYTTCFGKLLDMPRLAFLAQLVHGVLLRRTHSTSNDEVSFGFSVGGRIKQCTFDLHAFHLITGLNCGPFLVSSSSAEGGSEEPGAFAKAMLDGWSKITKKDLKEYFTKANSTDDMNMVKISLLYFLEFMVNSKYGNSPISPKHVKMLDDLDTFNQYPWGRVAFHTTLDLLKGVKQDDKGKRSKGQPKNYQLGGFPFAFQVWVFEALPTVGRAVAKKSGADFPRIFNWQTSGHVDHTAVEECLTSTAIVVKSKLKATTNESSKESYRYFRAVEEAGEESDAGEDELHDQQTPIENLDVEGREGEEGRVAEEAHSPEEPHPKRQRRSTKATRGVSSLDAKLDVLKAHVDMLKAQLDAMEAKIDRLVDKSTFSERPHFQSPFRTVNDEPVDGDADFAQDPAGVDTGRVMCRLCCYHEL